MQVPHPSQGLKIIHARSFVRWFTKEQTSHCLAQSPHQKEGHLLNELKETLLYLILGFWLCNISLWANSVHLEAAVNVMEKTPLTVYTTQRRRKHTDQGVRSPGGRNGPHSFPSPTGLASAWVEIPFTVLCPLGQLFSGSQGARIAEWCPPGIPTLFIPSINRGS